MQRVIEELGAAGLAKLHTIASPDRTIAALWTFEYRGSVSFFHSGFDPDYGPLSPGQVIHTLRIDEAIKNPSLVEYDFLDGDEPYKSMWANDERRLYTLTVSTGSWLAVPYRWALRLRATLSDSEWARKAYLWSLQKTSKAPEESTDEVQ